MPDLTSIDAVVFGGQGSQRPGMGLDLLGRPPARRVFDSASRVLGFDVSDVCRAEDGRLDLTEFAQPCILTVAHALFEILRAERTDFAPTWFAGHSLGEYAALVAAEALPFETAVRLVHRRGQIMQRAVAPGRGRMVAIMADPAAGIEGAMDRVATLCEAAGADVASWNSPLQCVVSGLDPAVDAVLAALRPDVARGEIRLHPLATSAPFHSRAMQGGVDEFAAELDAVSADLRPERARSVLSNTSGDFHVGTLAALCKALADQFTRTVRWTSNMDALARVARRIVELGPDRPLRGFFLARGIDITSVHDTRTLDRLPLAAA